MLREVTEPRNSFDALQNILVEKRVCLHIGSMACYPSMHKHVIVFSSVMHFTLGVSSLPPHFLQSRSLRLLLKEVRRTLTLILGFFSCVFLVQQK